MSSSHTFRSIALSSMCALALAASVGCSHGTPSNAKDAASDSSSAPIETTAASSSTSNEKPAEPASASSAATDQQAAPAANESAKLTREEASAQGYQVFLGTVRVCTAEELVQLQGIDIDPAALGGGGTYAVLVFDAPTDVTGQSGDGSGQRTESAKMLGIAEHTEYGSFVIDYGALEKCRDLDGQKVEVATKAVDITFPSDVRFPIGEPSTKSATFI